MKLNKQLMVLKWYQALPLWVGLLLLILCPISYGALSLESHSFNLIHRINNDSSINSDDTLIPIQIKYSFIENSALSSGKLSLADNIDLFEDIEPALLTAPLTYPNPFVLRDGAQIGYRVSKPMNLDIYIYNMRGHLIAKKLAAEGTPGGGLDANAYTKFPINAELFNNFDLSSGIYFYLIVHEGKVLGKGKMAIIP
ncbi:hypothetical protein DID77_01425 [Candidatus Marinamargulisbacteria bacterium SCGC AG-439-L15]|nr:hypothetical protein DID77_01425 [Candidatus Marinamargulisbacteria bacterium SCGC AG-439-L15]